ncbi:DNA-binding transcriptional LysR family regulator [Desulfitispora alkaliphila]|uniref:LysR family transcriptional regulator n=1 Tax=Desulfitispora alkaliphila TaxID=622674 RepID=UPI003D2564D2
MNLRQLKVFANVVKTGNMSEAAKELYMTQPAVSQTISDLENSLQVKLFDRISKNLILTDAGKVLETYANKILLLVKEAEFTIQDIVSLKQGTLRVGASTTVGIYMLPKLIRSFQEKYSQIQTFFHIDNTQVIESMILNHEIDIGLVEGGVGAEDITVKHLVNDELCLICSSEHPWVQNGRKFIVPEELEQETLILREIGSGTREIIEQALTENGVHYTIKHVLNNTEAIKKAVTENIGVAFVSEMAVNDETWVGEFKIMPVKNLKIARDMKFIYHQNKYPSPLFLAFVSHLEDVFN